MKPLRVLAGARPGSSGRRPLAAIGLISAAIGAGCGAKLPTAGESPPPRISLASGELAHPIVFGGELGKAPSLALRSDGSLAVAYGTDKTGDKHVYFATSSGGQTWIKGGKVGDGDLSDQDPALFSDGKNLHVVFASNRDGIDYALYQADEVAGSWGPARRLDLPGSIISGASVAKTSSGWSLAYGSTSGVQVADSPDGITWTGGKVAGTHLADPAIAQIDGRLTVVAHRNSTLFSLTRDGGGKWSAETTLGLPGQSRHAALAVDSKGKAALALATRADYGDKYQIALSTLDTGAWSKPSPVTAGDDDTMNPTLQFGSDGRLSLAWGINRTAGRGIYFAALTLPSGQAATPGGQ